MQSKDEALYRRWMQEAWKAGELALAWEWMEWLARVADIREYPDGFEDAA